MNDDMYNTNNISSLTKQINKEQKSKPNKIKEIKERNEFVEYLWYLLDENISPMYYSRTNMYINIKINGHDVKCLIDTGAQANIINKSLISKLGLDTFVDTNVTGNICGVGKSTSAIIGIIPYLELEISNVNCGINLQVIDFSGSPLALKTQVILSLPFLLYYQVHIDLKSKTLKIMNIEVPIEINE